MEPINNLDKSYHQDSRMYSPSGEMIPVCHPTLSGSMCLDDVKTGFYTGYNSIRSGQIEYRFRDVVYPPEIFSINDAHVMTNYIDPNGISKPEYRLCQNDPIDCDLNTSFIRDTQMVRNDIISSIMSRDNRQKYFSWNARNNFPL